MSRRAPGDAGTGAHVRDRGAIDVSIEMLVGSVALLALVLLAIEATAFWHARNVLDEAAAEGARVAAAFDGSCADGIAEARRLVARRAGSWASDLTIECSESGGLVRVRVGAGTPGVLFDGAGFRATVVETAPREG